MARFRWATLTAAVLFAIAALWYAFSPYHSPSPDWVGVGLNAAAAMASFIAWLGQRKR
jgi:hypothetical protein